MILNKKEIIVTLIASCFLNTLSTISMAYHQDEMLKSNDEHTRSDETKKETNISIKPNVKKTLKDAIAEAQLSLKEYKSTGDLLKLEESLKQFGNLVVFMSKEDNDKIMFGESSVHELFEQQRDELYKIYKSTGSGEYVIKYANEILSGWINNKDVLAFTEVFLVQGIVAYNEDKILSIQDDLLKIQKYYHQLVAYENEDEESDAGLIPPVPPSEEEDNNNGIPPEYIPLPPPEYEEGVPPISDSDTNNDGNSKLPDNTYTVNSYYKKEGNSCVLIEEKYETGLIIEKKKLPAKKEDYVHCGIYDYMFDDLNLDSNYGTELDEEYISKDQNVDSDIGVYYTVTKDEINSYYYNTGIRTNNNEEVSYNQLKDTLFQIAMKIKGFSSDTNTKTLTIIEGKPIVLRSEKELYSKIETEKLLDDYKTVDIEIRNNEDYFKKTPIEEYVDKNNSASFILGEKEFLITGIRVEGPAVMISLPEIAGNLGLKVVEDDSGEYEITGKTGNIKIKNGFQKYISTDGTEQLFSHQVKKIKSETYIELKTLCEEMGYSVEWDNESMKFILKNK